MDGSVETNCIARWKIGNIGNIVVHQELSRKTSATNRQQIGNIGYIIVHQQLNLQSATDRQHFRPWPEQFS
jgi:hypothetical protein